MGAEGGRGRWNTEDRTTGGKGAYVAATLKIERETKFYAFVGSKGEDASGKTNHAAGPGWNGGGYGGPDTNDDDGGGAGGGATDLRLNGNSLADRIPAAAGGSGSTAYGFGSPGDDTKSYTINAVYNESAYEASDKVGPLGQGQNGQGHTATASSGAGGGYYGGISVSGVNGNTYPLVSYSGTSFVAGYKDQDPMETDLSNAGVSILSRLMKAGFETFDAPGIGTERGHSGDG